MEALYIDLAHCDAKISLAKIEIQKYEYEKNKIQKLINESSKSNPNEIKKKEEPIKKKEEPIKKKEEPIKKKEEISKLVGIIPPKEIKDSDMENSKIPYKFLLDNWDWDETFPYENDFDEDEEVPFWTREKFLDTCDEGKMSISKLEDILKTKISYNYGDFINFNNDGRFGSMYIVGKNNVLYKNPDNSDSGGISIPLEITQFLDDVISKYGKDTANDIDIGHRDVIFENFNLNCDTEEHYLRKYYWTMDDQIFYEATGRHGRLIEKEKQTKSSNIRQLKDKVIVFTGGKDKDLIKLFEENNVKIGSGVSKNTFAVICKSKDEDSSKMTKAKELGISLLTLEEFKCKYV